MARITATLHAWLKSLNPSNAGQPNGFAADVAIILFRTEKLQERLASLRFATAGFLHELFAPLYIPASHGQTSHKLTSHKLTSLGCRADAATLAADGSAALPSVLHQPEAVSALMSHTLITPATRKQIATFKTVLKRCAGAPLLAFNDAPTRAVEARQRATTGPSGEIHVYTHVDRRASRGRDARYGRQR